MEVGVEPCVWVGGSGAESCVLEASADDAETCVLVVGGAGPCGLEFGAAGACEAR